MLEDTLAAKRFEDVCEALTQVMGNHIESGLCL